MRLNINILSKNKRKLFIYIICCLLFSISKLKAQEPKPNYDLDKKHQEMTVERERPAEWDNLVFGGRFMDLYLPMPDLGGMTSATWGEKNVIPRDINNGIEDPKWSYWGGNIALDKDGKYHLLVCRWPESATHGHMSYWESKVVHTVSDNPFGPFKVVGEIGEGHNPTWYTTKNGKYVLYVVDSYYVADTIYGPWKQKSFEFNSRDREVSKAKNFLHNCTFAKREDGSFLMVNRLGHPWFSKDGLSEWKMVGQSAVYPPVKGKYEDPVIWRDNVQYHLIVNDWQGRIAWYLRSKDGVDWKVEHGEAYVPGISVQHNGRVEAWHKYERIRMLQDSYGRAIAANFAVIDVEKFDDLPNDNSSSKNIVVPLTVGKLLSIVNREVISEKTKTIRVKIQAENNFNPHTDMDFSSLRFGSSDEVNYGRGSKLLSSEKSGKDLILVFSGKGNGLNSDDFAAKLLGKTSKGALLFGWSKLPKINYMSPILSPRKPIISSINNTTNVSVEIENFGQVSSEKAVIKIFLLNENEEEEFAVGNVVALKPFEKTTTISTSKKLVDKTEEYNLKVVIFQDEIAPVSFKCTVKID